MNDEEAVALNALERAAETLVRDFGWDLDDIVETIEDAYDAIAW